MARTSIGNSLFSQSKLAIELLILSTFLGQGIGVLSAQELPPPPPRVPTNQPGPARGQSVVSGRVVFDDTGQAVPKVNVQLMTRRLDPRTPIAPLHSITNDQGEFKFDGVAAGEYNVIAQVDPRVSGAQGYSIQSPPAEAAADYVRLQQLSQNSKRISVDGRNTVEVELRVTNPHFGAISGYVVSAGGDIAVRAHVMCSSAAKDGARTFSLSATTDEKGAFRIERLPPGEYLLSADPPPKGGNGSLFSQMPSFVPTYYPSTTDVASAMPITVISDSETPGVNITLIERSVHRISGSVKMRASGEPVARVVIQLSPRSAPNRATAIDNAFPAGRVPQIQTTDENGQWSFENVPDGDYTINVQARQLAPPRNSSPAAPPAPGQSSTATLKFSAKRKEVTVAGADLTDVAIELSAAARISGLVVVEGDKPLPSRIGILASSKDRTQPPASAVVQPDGSFSLNGVPEGEVSLDTSLRQPITFYVKSIEANGVDLLRERLNVEEGAEIKNVRIVISVDVALLTGHMFDSEGKTPLSRWLVVLVPVDPELRRLRTGQFTSMTGSDGSFSIGAAPGDYIVATWRPGEQSQLDSDTIAQSRLRVALHAGERQNLEILK